MVIGLCESAATVPVFFVPGGPLTMGLIMFTAGWPLGLPWSAIHIQFDMQFDHRRKTMRTLGLWGASLSLRIPPALARIARLQPGMTCTLRLLDDGTIRLKLTGPAAYIAATTSPAAVEAPVQFGDKTW
jgi:antitoxin component of MazEF toxin-antitoxin module